MRGERKHEFTQPKPQNLAPMGLREDCYHDGLAVERGQPLA